MKSIFALAHVFFNTSLDVSKKPGKKIGSYVYIILTGLVFAVIATILSLAFYKGWIVDPDRAAKEKYAIVIASLVFLSFFSIIFNFFSMYASLFKAKDFDFLASSPISKSNIIISKLLALFYYSLIIDGIAMLPVIIFYMVYGGTGVGFVCALVGTIFAGVIPLLLTTIIGAIVGVITAKSKYGDTISIIIYVVLFLGFTVGVIFMSSGSSDFLFTSSKILPYYNFLQDSFIKNDGMGLLYFFLINVAACVFVVVFTSLIYFPVNQMKKNNGNGKYVRSKEKTNLTTTRLLFKKEVNMVVRNLAFILSTYALPLIFFVVGFVVIGFINGCFLNPSSEKAINGAMLQFNYFQLGTSVLIASFCATTYASFSMEGRDNLQQLIVYPLDTRKIINAKIKASIIPIGLLFILTNFLLIMIFAIVLGFKYFNSPFLWLNFILLPALACVVTSFVGTLCGIKWIKLDFVDPNDVLKKSTAMGFTMLFSLLINGLITAGCLIIAGVAKRPDIGFAIGIAGYAIAIIVLGFFVHKNSVPMFEKAIRS